MATNSERVEYRMRQAYAQLQAADTALLLAAAAMRTITWTNTADELHLIAGRVLDAQDAIEKYMIGVGVEL